MNALILLVSLFVVSNQGFAQAPQITAVSGASRVELTGTVAIYGGLAGSVCSSSTTATCNNCSTTEMASDAGCTTPADGVCACNTARINDSLILTITATRPSGATGPLRLAEDTTVLDRITTGTNNDSVDIDWIRLCTASSAATSCENITGQATLTLKAFYDKDNGGDLDSDETTTQVNVYIYKPDTATYSVFGAADSNGIDTFTPYPGDEKVLIEQVNSAGTFPTMGYSAKIKKVRVFFSSTGLATANVDASSPVDLEVETNQLSDSIVDGLTNDTPYVFRLGLVDEAENVVQFFPAVGAGTNCETTPFTGCEYSATPSQVLGLLTDDFNCFVATAAYGSSLDPHLKVFRDFRYQVLLPTTWGRRLNQLYYKYGPYAARFIHDKPALRAAARVGLWPLYGFSRLALKIGFWPSTLLTLLGSLIAILAVRSVWHWSFSPKGSARA